MKEKEVHKIVELKALSLVKIMLERNMVKSVSEAKRLMASRGITFDGEKILTITQDITFSHSPKVLQVRKRKFLKIIHRCENCE